MYLTLQDLATDTQCFASYNVIGQKKRGAGEYCEIFPLPSFDFALQSHTIYVASDDLPFNQNKAESFFAESKSRESVAVVMKKSSELRAKLEENPHWKDCAQIVELDCECPSEMICIELLQRINYFSKVMFQNINKVSTDFFRMALKAEGIETMLCYFKEVIGNPVAIFDERFQCIATTDDIMRGNGRIQTVSKNFHLNNLYFNKQKFIVTNVEKSKVYTLISFPISFQGKVNAYLSILELGSKIANIDYLVLEIAVSSIMMQMKHALSIRTIFKRNVNNFLYDLFYREDKHVEDFRSTARTLGLEPDADFFTVVINVTAGSTKLLVPRTISNVLRPTGADEIFSLISSGLNAAGNCLLVGELGESIIALCKPSDSSEDAFVFIKETLRNIESNLIKNFNDSALLAGIGSVSHGIEQAETSFKNAKSALVYAKAIAKKGESATVLYQNNMLIKLFSSVGNRESLYEIIPEELKSLCSYDTTNQTQLVLSLSVYFECDCNAHAAAMSLHIHYKTMLYRLGKITKITSFNLSDSNEKLQLTLGIALMKILQIEPFNQALYT